MAILSLPLAAIAALATVASAYQPLPNSIAARADPYPFCNVQTNPSCIKDGRYLVPILEFSNPGDKGDAAFTKYLDSSQYKLKKWTNGLWPQTCKRWATDADKFKPTDFTVYNVTFPDQCSGNSPWVICYHNRAPKSIDDVAKVSQTDKVLYYPRMSSYSLFK